MKKLEEILSGINISNQAQKIYLSLLDDGKATAHTLALRTGITRTSVYDQIKILRPLGLVVERAVERTTFFEAGDPRQLALLLDDQLNKLAGQKKYLSENLENLSAKSRSVQPKIRFFESRDGVRQMLKDILWYDDITLYIFWPYEKMHEILGEDFLLWFDERRKASGIRIKSIWGHPGTKIKKDIFSGDTSDVERKYLSQKNIPSMGFLIYDQKVAFISSRRESFGFIVESAEFVQLKKMEFDILWNTTSKRKS